MLFSNFGLNDNDQNTLLKNGFSLLAAKTDCDTLIILEPGIPVKSIQFDSVEVAIDLAENFADMPLAIVSIDGELHKLSIELLDYYSGEFDLEWKPDNVKKTGLTQAEIALTFGLNYEDQIKLIGKGFVLMAACSDSNAILIHSNRGVTGVEYTSIEMALERAEFFTTMNNSIIAIDGEIHPRSTDWLIVFKDLLQLNYAG